MSSLSAFLLLPGLLSATTLTSSNTNGNTYGINSGSNAQQITLTVSANITDIDVEMVGSTSLTSISLEILSDNSGSPGSLLATDTSVTDAGFNGSTFTLATFNFSSPLLAAGTYWLETLSSGYSSWQIQTSYSSAGPDGSFTQKTVQYGNHDTGAALLGIVNGTVATPEPATCSSALAALGLLWTCKRRLGTRKH